MTTEKIGTCGGYGGVAFDDGVNDHVRKVIVGHDRVQGIFYIKIEYLKDGKVVTKEHGKRDGPESEFAVHFPDEYITSVWGTMTHEGRHDLKDQMVSSKFKADKFFAKDDPVYDINTLKRDKKDKLLNVSVSKLRFTTSHGRQSEMFGREGHGGTEFLLEGKKDARLVGFYGRSSDFLDAIGARFSFVSPTIKQLESLGGSDGFSWNDGAYDGLKSVCIGVEVNGDRISSVEFTYVNGDQELTYSHGKQQQLKKFFVLDHDDGEYIKSVEGTYGEDGVISSLVFITSLEREREEFGTRACTEFVLQAKGFDKIVGFRGRSSDVCINALGAHFAPVLAPPVKKLEAEGKKFSIFAKGEVEGKEVWKLERDKRGFLNDARQWDDGIHDGVYKICVTHNDLYVETIQFEYTNGKENLNYKTVPGDKHGHNHGDRVAHKKEFRLWLGDEYITTVEGHYGTKWHKINPETMAELEYDNAVNEMGEDYITSLTFKTLQKGNVYTYKVLGHDTDKYEYEGTMFSLGEEGYKVVGFHGRSESYLKNIGAYVKPT